MLISPKSVKSNEHDFHVKMGNSVLENVKVLNYMGVMIDCDTSFEDFFLK